MSGDTFPTLSSLDKLEVYGNECLSRIQVFEWFKRFKEGRQTTEDDPRPGQPSTSKPDENIEKIETHPDLPPLNQGTISKIETQYREMGHVRKVPSKRQAVVDDDTKLNLLLALEENPITPAARQLARDSNLNHKTQLHQRAAVVERVSQAFGLRGRDSGKSIIWRKASVPEGDAITGREGKGKWGMSGDGLDSKLKFTPKKWRHVRYLKGPALKARPRKREEQRFLRAKETFLELMLGKNSRDENHLRDLVKRKSHPSRPFRRCRPYPDATGGNPRADTIAVASMHWGHFRSVFRAH
ncbi:hypothetical protein NQ318_018525 [Aromia moschata]|uniref:Mos1 transposase HTH domain-containing protein n=1 Tax=Aromia moschata TaxID=1265417 RepID=A0AAV8ZF69_9CUCU|nr:hypothetical protein NQ318_018525 [Aromia moschata]